MSLSRKARWTILSSAAAMAAAFGTKNVLKYAWNATTGEDPPLNPASASTAWSEAVTWTVAASVVAGLSQLAARRAFAAAADGSVPDDQFQA